jgi:hypothetical protein
MVVGAAAQTGGNRWGDYSSMSIDPTDGCTFWYTQEYVAVGGSFTWQTWIGNTKFASCTNGPAGVIEGYVKSTAGGGAIAGASVQIGGSYSTTTNAAGFYQVTIPVGTYDVTATKFGYDTAGQLGQAVTEGGTTVVPDILLTPVGTYAVDGFVTAAEHNWPLWARIEVRQAGTLITTVYTSPWNGYYEIEALPNGFTYDFTVHSMYTGYLDEVRPVTIAAGDQVQSFSLTPASGNPAYSCKLEGGINETFEGGFPPLGWVVVNNGTDANKIWKRNDAWGSANVTGGSGFSAAAGPTAGGNGPYDTELWSPLVTLPATPRNIKFNSNFQDYAGNGDAYFQISTNGGGTWTTLLSYTVDDPGAGALRSADLTAYAGQTVIFRWRFVTGSTTAWFWQIDNVRTETIPVMPPPVLAEAFEGTVPPTDWTQTAVNTVIWKTNVAWGRTPNPVSGGTGNSAGCDVDKAGSGLTYDCSLITKAFDVSSLTTPTLSVKINYNDITTTATRDFFDIDASSDGGTTWVSVAHYVADFNGSATFDLTGKVTGANNKLRFRYYTADLAAHWDWYAYIDDLAITGAIPPAVVDNPTLVCDTVPGTLVAGFVTDANTATGITAATVTRDLGGVASTMAATGNLPAGFYYMFSASPVITGPSTRTFTASKDGYGPVEHAVNLIPDTVNRLDFALPAASLSLAGWPFVLDGRLTPDGLPAWDKTDMFSILNSGGLPAEVKLSVTALPQTFPHMFPAFVPAAPTAGTETSMKRAAKAPVVSNAKRYPGLARSLAGVPAYGVDVYPGGNFVSWADASVPGTWNVVASAAAYFGGDFLNGDFSTMYVLNYNTNQLASIATATGAATVIGAATPAAGESWTGLAGAPGGILYGASTTCGGASTLYTIDTASGEATVVGAITNTQCVIALAANAAGEIYAVDLGTDSLLKIDPATAAGTVVGPLGFDANYAQGMDFDEDSGTLYWAAYGASGELRTIDTATGASFLIGAFPGGAEVDAYAIATGGGGGTVPWLTLTPMEGTVPAAGQLDIDAEFFPEGVAPAHYGLFRGVIKSTNDTPNALPEMPVYFTKAYWDVPRGHWADAFIHSLAGARITRGCGSGNFCPESTISRAEMAVTMVRAMYGPDYAPPPAIGIFADVVISDTDTTADYIEQLYNDGVVAGCAAGPPALYCPNDLVNRAQMSVFVAAALGIPPVVPPTGYFTDVTGTAYEWAAPFAEALFNEGITAGCGDHLFCPATQITRAQLSVWLVTALGLPTYTHPAAPPAR